MNAKHAIMKVSRMWESFQTTLKALSQFLKKADQISNSNLHYRIRISLKMVLFVAGVK
jgi:hypothetical protein